MKIYHKLVWIFIAVQFVMIVAVALFFKVDDMTLSKGDIYDFNKGWSISREDGTKDRISELPYTENSEAGQTIIIENNIPKEYQGKTLFFLSADKTLKVSIDGEQVYEFGIDNKRLFGHTPGSVTNFVDIPYSLSDGHIKIEMTSPYDNYAASIGEIRIANRDVAILNLLKKNIFNIVCCVIMLFCGIVFAILATIRRFSHQSTDGMEYLSILSLISFVYYSIETKAMNILYGNQTIYSVLVFFILMMIPMLLLLYYENNLTGIHHKCCIILLALTCINIGVQMFLQCINCLDFMDMAVMSHGLIFLTSLALLIMSLRIAYTQRKVNILPEFFALLCLIIGGVMDLVRSYVVKIGDMGKFSRYGMTVFCLIMVIEHIVRISRNYSKSLEENAKLLQREVERQTNVANEKEAKLERLSSQIVMALVTAIDAKDRYTNGHSIRVARYSREIARRMGMSEQQQQDIYYIGLLHDIGKIGIPDGIINKKGRLTDEEYDIIKTHPVIGADILKNISEMPGIDIGARSHHERYDGKGYPDGLKGEQTPLIARIISVADAYDAMTSRRSYRDSMPQKVVREEIVKNIGKQFDPQIAEKILEMIDQDIYYEMREK